MNSTITTNPVTVTTIPDSTLGQMLQAAIARAEAAEAQLSLVDDYALYFHEACKLQESNSPKVAQPMPFAVWLAAQSARR